MQLRSIIPILFLGVFLASGCFSETNKNNSNAHYHFSDDSEGAKEFARALNEKDDAWDLITQGSRHYEAKEYDSAITKLKKALSVEGCDVWVARGVLGRAYEAKGEHALALNEINWQIAQGPRQDVIDKLQARKQNLEKLLSGK